MNDTDIAQHARQVVHNLVSDDRATRQDAWKELGKLGGAAVEPLIDIAKTWDDRKQFLVLEFAGDNLAHALADARAVEPLINGLRDENQRIRGISATTLGQTKDPRAFVPLVEALADPNERVRRSAIYALGQLDDERAISHIVVALNDPHERVRSAAAHELGLIGDRSMTPVLIAALDDPSERVVTSAISALEKRHDKTAVQPLIALLNGEKAILSAVSAKALGKLGDKRACDALENALRSREPLVRRMSIEPLVKLDPGRAIVPLAEILHDGDKELRFCAICALFKISNSQAADLIAEALYDLEPDVAQQAAYLLGKMGDSRAFEPLVDLLRVEPKMGSVMVNIDSDRYEEQDVNSRLRKIAADALGHLGDLCAIKPLVEAMENGSAGLSAAAALARLGDDRGFDALAAVMLSDAERQSNTAFSLGEIGDARVVEPLIEALRYESIAGTAAQALSKIGDPRAIEPLNELLSSGGKIAEDAAVALAWLGQQSGFDYLRIQLAESDERGASYVVLRLALIRDARAVDLLIGALKHPITKIRLQAAHSLGKLNDARAIGPLTEALNDPASRVRRAAAIALSKLGQYQDDQ